ALRTGSRPRSSSTRSPRRRTSSEWMASRSLLAHIWLLDSWPIPSPELGATYDSIVAPLADSEVLGLLEVGDRRDVRDGIDQIRLHRADRESQLLLDGREPLVVPGELCHLGLAQIRFEEVDLPGLDAQYLVGVEGVASELERGTVRGRAACLPVHEREAAVVGPEAEVGGHPHRRALEVQHLGPVLDRPVLGRALADRRHQWQPEEVAQAYRDVAGERLPHLGL